MQWEVGDKFIVDRSHPLVQPWIMEYLNVYTVEHVGINSVTAPTGKSAGGGIFLCKTLIKLEPVYEEPKL